MTPQGEVEAGDLYDFRDGAGWCRHGLLRAFKTEAGMILVDTYWGGLSDGLLRNWHTSEQVLGRTTFLLNLNRARVVRRTEWEVYADADRAWIPVGGGSEQFYVAEGALPLFARQADQLRRRVEEAESSIRFAQFTVERAQKELKDLYDAHTAKPTATGVACAPDCATCREALAARTETR